MSIEEYAAEARVAIERHTAYGRDHASFAQREIRMEADRVELKAKLIAALIGTDNEQTKRPHSAQSAEDTAKADPRYLDHQRGQGEVVAKKNHAKTEQDSAYLTALLCIALVQTEAGVA